MRIQQLGFFSWFGGLIKKAWKAVKTAVSYVGQAFNTWRLASGGGFWSFMKNIIGSIGTAALAVGREIRKLGSALGNAILDAAGAVWENLKAAALSIAKMACRAVATFMSTVVRGLFTGMMELAKAVVYSGGKLIKYAIEAAAMVFEIRYLAYTGSLKGITSGGFGNLKLQGTVSNIDATSSILLLVLQNIWER